MALSFLLKMVSVAGLMIRYVAILCHLSPKVLRNAALKDNGDGISSALRTQRYGIGPVSYTHLDVYKRQGKSIGKKLFD